MAVELVGQSFAPFDERDAVLLPIVDEAAANHVLRAAQPVQVLVEEWQATVGVLGHEREAGAVDHVVHAEPGREPLRELSLPCAERPEQCDAVAGLGDRAEGRRERPRLLGTHRPHGRAREHVPARNAVGENTHRATLPESANGSCGARPARPRSRR